MAMVFIAGSVVMEEAVMNPNGNRILLGVYVVEVERCPVSWCCTGGEETRANSNCPILYQKQSSWS